MTTTVTTNNNKPTTKSLPPQMFICLFENESTHFPWLWYGPKKTGSNTETLAGMNWNKYPYFGHKFVCFWTKKHAESSFVNPFDFRRKTNLIRNEKWDKEMVKADHGRIYWKVFLQSYTKTSFMGFPTYIVLSPEHTEVVFGSRRNKHLTIKTQIGTCQSPMKPFFGMFFHGWINPVT